MKESIFLDKSILKLEDTLKVIVDTVIENVMKDLKLMRNIIKIRVMFTKEELESIALLRTRVRDAEEVERKIREDYKNIIEKIIASTIVKIALHLLKIENGFIDKEKVIKIVIEELNDYIKFIKKDV